MISVPRVRPQADDFTREFRDLNKRLSVLESRVPSRNTADRLLVKYTEFWKVATQSATHNTAITLTLPNRASYPDAHLDDWGTGTQLVAPWDGLYAVNVNNVRFSQSGSFGCELLFRKNGDTILSGRHNWPGGGAPVLGTSGSLFGTLTLFVRLEAAEYLELRFMNNTGSTGNVTIASAERGYFAYLAPTIE
jgi:hypothetical protein